MRDVHLMDTAGIEQAFEQQTQGVIGLYVDAVAGDGTGERLHAADFVSGRIEIGLDNAVAIFRGG